MSKSVTPHPSSLISSRQVVLKIVIQLAGGEDHPDVAEALDTHAMLLKLQVGGGGGMPLCCPVL